MTLPQKILIVEDMVTQAIRLQQLFKTVGVTGSVIARSGADALNMIKQDPTWEAIVSDINMPEMDGFALCRQVKQIEEAKAIPFVLLVSLREPLDGLHALECGADNVMLKEYDKDYFVPQLALAIKNAREGASEATETTRVFHNGEWHEFKLSSAKIAAMMLSTFTIALHEKAARLREPAGAHK